MPNYQNGKIYKLVSNISSDIYIGSTVNKLSHRLCEHKNKSNQCVSKQLFANDAVIQIILIESCPCNSKSELTAREHHFITTLVCINKKIPFVTDIIVVNGDQKEWQKAYNKLHAVERAAYRKTYDESHAVEIAAKQKTYRESHVAEKAAYIESHAAEISAKKKTYRESHADEIAAYNKSHKAEIAAQQKAYRELHAAELAAKRKAKYLKKKAQTTELIV